MPGASRVPVVTEKSWRRRATAEAPSGVAARPVTSSVHNVCQIPSVDKSRSYKSLFDPVVSNHASSPLTIRRCMPLGDPDRHRVHEPHGKRRRPDPWRRRSGAAIRRSNRRCAMAVVDALRVERGPRPFPARSCRMPATMHVGFRRANSAAPRKGRRHHARRCARTTRCIGTSTRAGMALNTSANGAGVGAIRSLYIRGEPTSAYHAATPPSARGSLPPSSTPLG